MRAIKLSDTHYIIVDDSEIKETPCCNITHRVVVIPTDLEWATTNKDNLKVITHSTQPLSSATKGWSNVKIIPLSEVEEAVYGYSVEKIYAECDDSYSLESYTNGFKAHQKLVKDKLFTIDDMKNAFLKGINFAHKPHPQDLEYEKDFIQSLLPKTEWDVEFDEQGKIKLIL